MTTYAYDQLVTALNSARADVIRGAAPAADDCDQQAGVDKAAKAIAVVMRTDDPAFDVDRFLTDVGARPSHSD